MAATRLPLSLLVEPSAAGYGGSGPWQTMFGFGTTRLLRESGIPSVGTVPHRGSRAHPAAFRIRSSSARFGPSNAVSSGTRLRAPTWLQPKPSLRHHRAPTGARHTWRLPAAREGPPGLFRFLLLHTAYFMIATRLRQGYGGPVMAQSNFHPPLFSADRGRHPSLREGGLGTRMRDR